MKQTLFQVVLLSLMVLAAGAVSAQWAVGVRGGWTSTTITRSNAGRIDETYSAQNGLEFGVMGRYAFNPWLAVRANLSFMQRSHRMDRNLNYIDPVYTVYSNSYLMLPVEADFSFGGQRLRGHLLAGGYGGYWLARRSSGTTYWMTDYYVYFDDFYWEHGFSDSDIRFCAGLVAGAALSYSIDLHWQLSLDALYYYDLTSHHRGYEHLADPRYLNTIALNLSVLYNF
ncbi:MAG: PorT family protein [Bacteroidales bacterium]|nr:PorT family protein [Bacteroidales bacterium]